jgi:hypothetical protein
MAARQRAVTISVQQRAERLSQPREVQPLAPVRAPAKKLVAIAVPLSLSATLSETERISLRHLAHFLDRHDKYLVCPRSSSMKVRGFQYKAFDDRYFGSASAYTRLMLSRSFYETFSDYEFILIYHLDALVFSDQLIQWCGSGYDFIGAPWLRSPEEPERGFSQVGNGGFSLRRVSSLLEVIDSTRRAIEPNDYWNKYFASRSSLSRLVNQPRRWLKHLRMFNNARHEMSQVTYNEDRFWSLRATHFHRAFRIAPVEVALEFAFESAPRYCFDRNRQRLPFGCHAWERYDRAFWEQFVLRGEANL